MKTKYLLILAIVTFMLVFTAPAERPGVAYAASITDGSVIVLSGEISDDQIVINANLVSNTGTSAMVLQIEYDANVMTLSNVIKGDALNSLEYMTTNPDSDQGYAIKPFKILYSPNVEAKNDMTTGKLFTMIFNLKDDAPNGKYDVSLSSENNGVVYVDGGSDKTKSLLVDGVTINVKNNAVTDIKTGAENQADDDKNVGKIVALSVSGAVLIAAAIVVIIVLKRRKVGWTRI